MAISTTILGSILGFAGSALEPLFGYFENKQNHKLEVKKMEKAAELRQAGFEQDQVMYMLKAQDNEHQRLIDHDIAITQGRGFIAGIQKLVRPTITYAFFGLFAYVEYSIVAAALESNLPMVEALELIWDADTQAIFATIISFWFGNRVFEKRAQRAILAKTPKEPAS